MSENVQNKAFVFITSSIAHIVCVEIVLLMSDTYVNSLYTCQRCLLGQCVVSCFFVLLTTSVSVILCWSVNVNMFLTHVESYVVSALCLHLTRLVVFVGDFFYTIAHRLCNWIMLWAIALSPFVCAYVGYVWVWYVHSGMSYLVAIHGIASMWGPKFHLPLHKDVMCVDCCLLL